jgi:GNAT superfamily N-acetyltransferase
MERIKIIEVREVSDYLIEGMNSLLSQLSSGILPLRPETLEEIIRSGCSKLFIAVPEENECIISGMLTLVFIRIPTGTNGRIEDVVVDSKFRGRGIGHDLTLHAIKYARSLKLKSLYLTSRPERQAANKLYQKLGFEHRETNVYQMVLSL